MTIFKLFIYICDFPNNWEQKKDYDKDLFEFRNSYNKKNIYIF